MAKVPFLKDEFIENATLCLLDAYGRDHGGVARPPIPVDAIIESHFKLTLDYDDLSRLLGIPGVLGATYLKNPRVIVDQSLDPTEDPSKTGRNNFTLAHEIGHWELHRHLLMGNPLQTSLFGDDGRPAFICRSRSNKEPMEWQADRFAGFLLMPRKMVLDAWRARHGELRPYVAEAEMVDLSARWGLGKDERPTVGVARELAQEFCVSGQAMQIRLIGLGLIVTGKPEPDLF